MRRTAMVMGGSLGGLNAALFLRDAGFDVDVFERSRTPLEGQGAGIVLNPATVRYLVDRRVGDVCGMSVATGVLRYLDRGGQVVAEHPEPYRFSSYDTLYRALLGSFGRERYHLGQDVTGFVQDSDRVTLRLASGEQARGDMLVCADGIRSAARRQLAGVEPRYAGYVAWRGTALPGDLTPATNAVLRDAITYCVLPNSHALIYAIPGPAGQDSADRRLNWLWYRNVAEGPGLDRVMTDRDGARRTISLPPGHAPDDRLADLRSSADQLLPPQIAELITATSEPFIQAVFDAGVKRMAFDRVCLIGDAAFACRPHAAAGSAKAAEDAFQLGEALRDAAVDVPAALAAWEPGQLELGRSLLARTRAAGDQSQVDCTWQVGQPLPFGLHRVGDSSMSGCERDPPPVGLGQSQGRNARGR
jgi:2,6-dihydroxypyridine 3-monooxygenase